MTLFIHNTRSIEDKFFSCWSLLRILMETTIDKVRKFNWILIRNFWIFSLLNFFVKTFNIFTLKRWMKSTHLINNTSKRPNIWSCIIRLIFPNFRTCIIRSSCLSIGHLFLLCLYFRYIHISNLKGSSRKKDICSFEVSMKNAFRMKKL